METISQTRKTLASRRLPPLRSAWWVWAMAAPLYLVGFFHRVAPAVMTAELMRTFAIGATALGNLSAFYFYSYVLMQIPTGILADRWGPRRLLTAGALVAGVGGVFFALAPSLGWAYLGRFLIGASVAVAWIGLLKVASEWFPPQLFAMVTGVGLLSGILGAVGAGPPLRLLMDHAPWRSVMLAVAGATLAVGAGVWIVVRDVPGQKGFADYPHTGQAKAHRPVLAGLAEVLRFRNAWLLFVIPGGFVGAILTFAGLWGVPFLTTHYGLSTSRAAMLTSVQLASWALASPLFGWFSDRLGRRKPLYLAGGLVALSAWCALVYLPDLPLPVVGGLLVATGCSTGAMIVSFAFAKESVPTDLAGTVSGLVNMGVMLGPMILQPLVGWVLDACWTGTLVDGVRHYDVVAYRIGFSLMLGWLAFSLLLLVFTRETHCRHDSEKS
ncbi:MAG: MFS transporter [Desulfobacteraceae bacterium]|jgi:MFS family permease|nr:MFS transporter [Desulfobacteraceae bacterium]